MSNSKSCENCGAPIPEIAPGSAVSICPSCLRSTPGITGGQTLDEGIRDLAPTADFAAEQATADYSSVGPEPSSAASRALTAEAAGLTAWEQSKVLELAARGYRVVRKLGEGGFGVVFQAIDAAERAVAIKMLHAGLGSDRYRQRFALEANALTRLDDPGLVRLFHYDVSGPEPMLVTEFVPGGTLARKLAGRVTCEPHAAADAVRQLAASVQIVHDAGLIHRDIKPSNILIGADEQLKLGDFGLAKRLDREDGLTPTGRGIGGTPEYSAPEQFRGSGDCDSRADIYALGATLYRLLTGKPVFERTDRDDLVAVILRVLGEEPVPPRKLRADIPPRLEAVCLKCLAKNPADRYATAAELGADLKNWHDERAKILARPSTRLGRAWKRVRRAPKFPVAMVLTALLGLGAAFVLLSKPEEPLAAMKRQLAKDGRLELQGETGKPRWHNFPIGGPELSESLIGDKACSFESLNICVLELFPEAPADHFRLRVDLRFVESRVGADPDLHPYIGAFVAGQRSEGPPPAKASLYTLTGLYFEEGPTARANRNVRFTALRIAQNSESLPGKGKSGLGHLPFLPSATLPGPWRTFEIEVWHDPVGRVMPRMVIPNAAGGATTQDFTVGLKGGEFTRAAIQPILDKQAQSLRALKGFDDVPYPAWNPRGAVGIWGYKAAVDFKNVSVTVLP